jgi:hypothetical protein
MLVQALVDHFEEYFRQHSTHDIVLWFDPHREYAALVDQITRYPLWRYAGSLLELRYRLVHREDGERVVVYLPLSREDAEVLRPFFATSYAFEDGLYRFLRQQGFDFPDDPQVAHELRALLPRLAARSLGKGRAFWDYNLANLERARETLLGNFDDTLLRFLASPKERLAELTMEQLDGLFFAQLESAYGFSAIPDEPEKSAKRLTAQLALVNAFVSAGKPDDFPYAARLPEAHHFDRNLAFLRSWQRDTRYKPVYRHYAERLERQYDLARWASQLPLSEALRLEATFASVEEGLWERVRAELEGLHSEEEWRIWLEEHRGALRERATGFWAQEGWASWWEVLLRTSTLLSKAHEVREALDRFTAPQALLERYTESWWRIDRDFRILRESLNAQAGSYGALRDRITRSYRDVLSRMNVRFTDLLPRDWPPPGLEPQEGFWDAIEGERDKRTAVFFIDALRYELGQSLLETLTEEGAGQQRSVTARLAAIPTVTPIGMTAALPRGAEREVGYDSGWKIHIASSDNLSAKAARKRWLESALPGVIFYNLDQLLDTRIEELIGDGPFIVFDTTLDRVGESAGTLAWSTFSVLLNSVRKGIHKLLDLGVEEVHVIADHGFLLLDQVGEHEKVSVTDVQALTKHERYLVGRHLGSTDQLSYPVPGSEGLQAWFPRGIGCFRTPGAYNYVHGGLSLQELVIPHLHVEQPRMGRPVRVVADFPAVIRNAQPVVTVRADRPEMFDRPRQVTLTLEKDGEALTPPLSQLVDVREPVKMALFLPMDVGLEPKDRVCWVLRDAHTGEVLAEQEAVSQVDLW